MLKRDTPYSGRSRDGGAAHRALCPATHTLQLPLDDAARAFLLSNPGEAEETRPASATPRPEEASLIELPRRTGRRRSRPRRRERRDQEARGDKIEHEEGGPGQARHSVEQSPASAADAVRVTVKQDHQDIMTVRQPELRSGRRVQAVERTRASGCQNAARSRSGSHRRRKLPNQQTRMSVPNCSAPECAA